MERTFAMVKPDGVQRALVGDILARFEKRGLKIVAMRLFHIPRSLAEEHYGEHKGKPFFAGLVDFITSGPVVAMVLEGRNAIQAVRDINGATDPKKAAPGTIRADYALDIGRNVVHGSDSDKAADREIKLFFSEKDLVMYARADEKWVQE
ncbi:MAG: nucleoside-diphosphate kinase [Euryarchaeota archaeon]|nr:nucleoside-diphosphate kinase [Euryarchaeota archaeon]